MVASLREIESLQKIECSTFQFIGVRPCENKYRDYIDWLYLLLWIFSVIYQALLLLCFFKYPDNSTFVELLDAAFEPYYAAVSGYGIFNIFHRYRPNNRRSHNIKVKIDNRKKRNGHRFILYWWLNFLIMLFAALFFGYSGLLTGAMKISLKIALICLVIWFGYFIAKRNWLLK